MIGNANNTAITAKSTFPVTTLAKFPNKIPTIVKSASEKVVFAKPSEPSTGSNAAAKKVTAIP